jgi:hypothetical protein
MKKEMNMRKALYATKEEIVNNFVHNIPNAIKFVMIPSQDRVDVYFDNVHSQDYRLSEILSKAIKKAKQDGFDLEIYDK